MKRIIFLALLMVCYAVTNLSAQKITTIQYYFNTDPGVGVAGNGAIIAVTPDSAVTQAPGIVIPSLPAGFNYLYVRAKDDSGRWSIAERKTLFILSALPLITQKVTALEYFFDNDPGVGNGIPLPVTTADSINKNFAIVVPADSIGTHNLYVRARDETGSWSLIGRDIKPFLASACLTTAPDTTMMDWWYLYGSNFNAASKVTNIAGANDGVFLNWNNALSAGGTFDGVDDYIGVPDDVKWAFGTKNFTIELLASFSAPGGDFVHPADKLIGQSEGAANAKKWTLALGNGKLFFNIRDGSTSKDLAQTTFAPVKDQLYHLALTRSGDTLRVYIDGQLKTTEITINLVIPDVNSPLTIGFVDWLQGGDQGYMKGVLDEITIYRRALSGNEIKNISDAGRAGKCKQLTITTHAISDAVYGSPVSQTLTAMFGIEPYQWSITAGSLPTGVTLDNSGALSGTPEEAGEFDVRFHVKDVNNDTTEKTYIFKVLMTMPEPQVSLFKSGTSAVPGRKMDYFILLENKSNTAIDSVGGDEFLQPWFKYISSSPSSEIISYMPDFFSADSSDTIPWILEWIVKLKASEFTILSYKVKLDPSIPAGNIVRGEVCEYIPYTNQQRIGFRKCQAEDLEARRMIARTCNRTFRNDPGGASDCMMTAYHSFDLEKKYKDCMKRHNIPLTCKHNDKDVVIPHDPNEKLVLAEKYIQAEQLLPYVIHFENIGNVEAQDVFVTDTLDANLDLSTLKVLKDSSSCSVDTVKRIIRWNLLNKNLMPDSSDYVMYSVKPKAGLTHGRVIKNRATIQFEIFAPMSTNETINIIDHAKPEGVMNALPDTMYQTSFPISWKGIDAGGEIKNYSVFVAADDGGYVPFVTNTEDTTTIFTGENGKAYRLICIATDLAGNIEIQEPTTEATTYVKVLCNNKFYRDADNDGFGDNGSFTLACDKPNGYASNSTDCNDANATVNPGASEICNFIDNDCDGQIDEGALLTIYVDRDNDNFGNPDSSYQFCSVPVGFVLEGTDCDDHDAMVHPGAIEIQNNSIDDNCNGQTDEFPTAVYTDAVQLQSLKAYPNPFSNKLNIEFTLIKNSKAKLEILDVTGKTVDILFNGEVKGGKAQKLEYNPKTSANGVVFYRLQSDNGIYYGRAMMVK